MLSQLLLLTVLATMACVCHSQPQLPATSSIYNYRPQAMYYDPSYFSNNNNEGAHYSTGMPPTPQQTALADDLTPLNVPTSDHRNSISGKSRGNVIGWPSGSSSNQHDYYSNNNNEGAHYSTGMPPTPQQSALADDLTPLNVPASDHRNSNNGNSRGNVDSWRSSSSSNRDDDDHSFGVGGRGDSQSRRTVRTSNYPVVDFAWSVFRKVRTANRRENLVFSPLLLQTTLALLRTAAIDETAAQLAEVIKHMQLGELHELSRKSIALSTTSGSSNRLDMASAIFADHSFDLSQTFVDEAQSQDIGVSAVNFANADVTTKVINDWVANATANKVRNMFGPDQVREQTVLLMNALYFKGFWRNRFAETLPGQFHLEQGELKSVMFMHSEQLLRIQDFVTAGGQTGTWVEIPYKGNEFSMILIVPANRFQLDHLIRNMTAADVNEIFSYLNYSYMRKVNLKMPKFEIKTSFSLVNTLQQMGLIEPFTMNSQLPLMTKSRQRLKIDDILQNAVLKVDEVGSEAAVAQAVFAVALSYSEPPLRRELIVDQPFVVMIVDTVNKVPLFMAKIFDP